MIADNITFCTYIHAVLPDIDPQFSQKAHLTDTRLHNCVKGSIFYSGRGEK